MSNGILGVSQLEMLTQSGTGTITVIPPATNTNRTLTLPDETGTVVTTASLNPLTSGTAVASTSGTAIDFTGIPSWVKRITVMFDAVSTSGTSELLVKIGTSSGIQSTGYAGNATYVGGGSLSINMSTGFTIRSDAAAETQHGLVTLGLINATTGVWCMSGVLGHSNEAYTVLSGGSKTLSGVLDRVQITSINGTDTFDAGLINIMYE